MEGEEVYRAVKTEYHNWVALNKRNIMSHSSGDKKSKIKCSLGLTPPQGCEEDSVTCLSPKA